MYLEYFTAIGCIIAVGTFLPEAGGQATTIKDERVQRLDISPVLGRGYSIMTNTFQSTCLIVTEVTAPSIDYDNSFNDFSDSNDVKVDAGKKLSHSLGYPSFAKSIQPGNGPSKPIYLVNSMRIERYYTSMEEQNSPLSNDAKYLLGAQDYVGFFKACGPSYVRSIQRAQEMFTIFSFKSTSRDRGRTYASRLQMSSWLPNRRGTSESSTLQIIIKGYGFGLTDEGSETLMATSMSHYAKVQKYAYNVMTRNDSYKSIGMIYGIQVIPWAHNPGFQSAAKINEEVIEVPMVRSLVPKAHRKTDPTDLKFDNDKRAEFECSNLQFKMDQYGYCCEPEQLYNYVEGTYDDETPNKRTCRVITTVPPAAIKDNMVANGEFVARLDRTVRYKLNQLSVLERCISAVNAIPEKFLFYVLKQPARVLQDKKPDDFSVFELKMALDTFGDYGLIEHMATELDEFMDMQVQPCYAALFGMNVGTTPETDASYFMAYPWFQHKECTMFTCLAQDMQWDREKGGGCVPSLIAANSKKFDSTNEDSCSKDSSTGTLKCKHNSTQLATYYDRVTKCWDAIIPNIGINALINEYCLPEILPQALPPNGVIELKTAAVNSCESKFSVNIAVDKPAYQSSVYWSTYRAHAALAVDGNTNGNYRKRSVAHTRLSRTTWWYVDLQGTFNIKEIMVWHRTDAVKDRARGFTTKIYKNGTVVWTNVWNKAIGVTSIIEVGGVVGGIKVGVDGDKVEISLQNKNQILQLAEVQVFN